MDFKLLFIYFASLSIIIPCLLSIYICLENKRLNYVLSYCIVFSIVEIAAAYMASNGIHNSWFYNIVMNIQFFIFSKIIGIKNQFVFYGAIIFGILNYFFGEGIGNFNSITFNVHSIIIIVFGLKVIQKEYLKNIDLKFNYEFLFISLISISRIFYILILGIYNLVQYKINFIYRYELDVVLGVVNIIFYSIWTYLLWKQYIQTKL